MELVINFNMPRKLSDYIHRVGRTARKGLEGEALTFVTENEVQNFLEIEKSLEVKMTEQKVSENDALDEMKIFNKALREAKLHLSNTGMLETFDKKKS